MIPIHKEIPVNAFEAKTKFSALLRSVQGGESYLITLRGEPVARLIPVDRHFGFQEFIITMDQAREFRSKIKSPVPILEYKEEGRQR